MIKYENIQKNENESRKLPSPSEFLKQAIGRKVIVKLNNNYEYKGKKKSKKKEY